MDARQAVPRTQSAAAVSADGKRWFLLNVSPDVREQLAKLVSPEGTDVRRSSVAGIVLTDAELDHTLGLALLRESSQLLLYATCAVQSIVERDSRILAVTRAFADVRTVELPLQRGVALRDCAGPSSGLTVEAFAVPAGPPRFARDHVPGHTVGLVITDETTGGRLGFVPGCGHLDAGLRARLAGTDLLLFDGTFWSDNELIRLGIGDRRASEMDHLPIGEPGGSLEQLAELDGTRTVYTHINNTNPILLEQSPERQAVLRAGITIGQDGMEFTI
jgi:pyrroloquinoline quinone biosynthesis protein B